LLAVQEGAATAAKHEVSKLFETSERLARLSKVNSDLQITHRDYVEARIELETQLQLYELEPPGKGGAPSRDQMKAQIAINRARQSLDTKLNHLRTARAVVQQLHNEVNVDASAILMQFDE